MKVFLFLVLSLAIFGPAAFAQTPGGWSNVDADTVNNSPNIQEALLFGTNYAIHHGIQQGTIEDADYQIINIFSVRTQVVSGINFEFEIELATDEEYYVKLTFVIWLQSWKRRNSMKVTSFDFSPLLQQEEDDFSNTESEFDFLPEEVGDGENNGGNQNAGGWSSVELSELNSNTNMRSAFHFGMQHALQRLVENEELPRETYHENRLFSIEIQIVNGYNYRFDVQVEGNRGAVARIVFEVYSHPSTDTQKLTYFSVVSERN